MARKPVNKISALQTRDALWAAIRAFGCLFTSTELRSETRCSSGQTADYLKGLTAAGILELVSANLQPGKPHQYRLIKDCGIIAPRVRKDGSEVTQGRSRRQIWATMRILGTFDFRSLAISASTEEIPVNPTEANDYCLMLAKAGYLKVIIPSKPGTAATYRMLPHKYTGPRPPQIQRVNAVYDPNLGKVVWTSLEGRHDA